MTETLKLLIIVFLAVFLQLLLTRHYEYFYFLDLHLVAVIYFATCRTRIQASLIGGAVGLVQDSISGLPLGMNGFTKTLSGYLAAAICSRLVLETFITRLLLIFLMSLMDSSVKSAFFWVAGMPLPPRLLLNSLLQAFVTGTLGSAVLTAVQALLQRRSRP